MTEKRSLDDFIKLISDSFEVESEKITKNSELLGELKFDSLDSLELMMDIEDKYKIHIPDEEYEISEKTTIEDLYNYLKSKGY